MVTLFKRPGAEEGLDARIAGLRRTRGETELAEKPVPASPPVDNTMPPPGAGPFRPGLGNNSRLGRSTRVASEEGGDHGQALVTDRDQIDLRG